MSKETTYAVFYEGLRKVLIGESDNAKTYIRVLKHRLKKGNVRGEIQKDYSKSPEKFKFFVMKYPPEEVYKMCEKKGYNFYNHFAGLNVTEV